ncbi:hypothetical protein EX895_001590 [Sporisorium graminicola]|uniref:Magnesium transporter n=1 Tax=Sporisorium graminicola TaxID=280036 RepID=A0A4V6EU35_9BASI|nr:hypothetical protein EX895_001590 [Sporisorium graminicola]TKY89059.1 hypothetical protein EX895_001590 [Sporisorium graminicola]
MRSSAARSLARVVGANSRSSNHAASRAIATAAAVVRRVAGDAGADKGKARQRASFQTSALLCRTLHTASASLNAASSASKRSPGTGTPSSSSSSSMPPGPAPSPSSAFSYPPSSFAGLGTTQLSPDIMLRCTIFDSTGSATSTSGVFKKSRLCSVHGLEPRDLRKIDSRVPNLVPTILARRGGILVNILHIRAMIKKDKVLLFDSYGSTDSQLHSAFVYNLQHNLRPHSSNGGLAYEFRALESILVSVLDALRIELGVVRGWTSGVLEELDDDVDREKLRTLLQVSRKLNAFLSRGKAVKNAVVEVLENEEDMQLMYLSDKPPAASSGTGSNSSSGSASPNSSTAAGSAKPSTSPSNATPDTASAAATDASDPTPAMDELELLLESFDKQVEEVVAETTQLHSDITNTQEVVELILDNNRNKLLALDLRTSIATMGISAGTLWAGLFGMNLKSHMEELDWAFAGVSGVAFGAVCLTAGIGLRRLERLRRVGLGMGKKVERRKAAAGWLGMWRGKKGEQAMQAPSLGVGLGGMPTPGYVPAYQAYHPSAYSGDSQAQAFDHAQQQQQQQHAASWWSNPALSSQATPPPPSPAPAAAGAAAAEANSSIYNHGHTSVPPPHSPAATGVAAAGRGVDDPYTPPPAGAAAETAGRAGLGLGLGSKWDSSSFSFSNGSGSGSSGGGGASGAAGAGSAKKRRKP